ncbi:MAG: DUF4417 domain-containing protein [Eubacterium sp.]|nr:DUF4417 domain-containing protein [Eubacterium sp.]
MAIKNSARNGCKDVFRSYLVRGAKFAGNLELPVLKPSFSVPEKVITFSKAIRSTDYECWVHFYEDDTNFERIWNNPQKYLPILKKFKGVISPDFSLYRDMPLVMQQWNIYRNRAIACWLQNNGIEVIPNIRFADFRTYESCCLGVEKHSVIAIGTHGCIKVNRDREYLIDGLDYIVKALQPSVIVVYGTAPNYIFDKYIKAGIQIIQFQSEFHLSRKAVSA